MPTRNSHDHNFKNLFQDFSKEVMEWIYPEAIRKWGEVRKVEFLRQEPRKPRLSDRHLILDLPVLYTFDNQRLILWLVEFQEDKSRFSIYKLARYVLDYLASYPDIPILPTVLFTDRKRWRKQVPRELNNRVGETRFQFKYQLIRLFEYQARDYFTCQNPVVKILLPKMSYTREERSEVIRQAYRGLFELSPRALFDKYIYFIDLYAEISYSEREGIYQDLQAKKETAMLADYIKEKGVREGVQQGLQQGLREGIQEGARQGEQRLLARQISKKYRLPEREFLDDLKRLTSHELEELGEKVLDLDSWDEIMEWYRNRKNVH